MKNFKVLLLTCVALFALTSCFEDMDDNPISTIEINDFVWKGMNAVYAYKDEITDLANDRFNSNDDYTNYLNEYASPEDLFESLLYLPNDIDEFSVIVPNYLDLEQLLQGTTYSNGMAYGLVKLPNAAEDVIGYVRYVMPNTDAEAKGVTRGMIFNTIDGAAITESNFSALLNPTTYTIGWADYDNNGTTVTLTDDIITSNNETLTLTKSPYTENPILTHNVLNVSGSSIGYLMYNGFRIGNENLDELNNVFAEFQSAGVSDLVLDLRYNGGGSVDTAIWLASMITGQYTGEVFFKEKWNTDILTEFEQSNPEALLNPFVTQMTKRNTNGDITYQQSINSLNLNKVYIITTRNSASASELVINGLSPYIDVVQVGSTTRGKSQASRTIYDSPNLSKENVNPNHKYAMQPLIYEAQNADGYSEFYNGLSPDPTFQISEYYENLGELGNIEERLLAEVIADITGLSRASLSSQEPREPIKQISDQNFKNPFRFDMVDDRPLEFNLIN
ncbi:S41 family peptidase [Winogradskyella thalassocola]|uniref:C-terminal processing protease CtpA/Prc, contains a PDZ domain n=1 Tax=Winogradskyella thalassocola TaxID=262004 RepID=A0A1G8B2P6_9FLAO|nr:S41 family peptidase [Winogradskyella thalassocola]SDH27411.1 C-terminal processing protease CtpA/Prc, contains a PDZ domain [Winogradskyella thalassocola]